MNEPIISRERITAYALQAARLAHAGHPPANPYPTGTAAHKLWSEVCAARLAQMEAEDVAA